MDSNEASGRASGGYGRRLRASDADRAATAERLRTHYTDGRLDAQEYDERIERCYAAKTVDELDALFFDLPRSAPRPPESGYERPHWGGPPWRLAAVVPVVVALIALSVVTGAHLIWFAWPLFFLFFRPFGCWRRGRRGNGTTTA